VNAPSVEADGVKLTESAMTAVVSVSTTSAIAGARFIKNLSGYPVDNSSN
jgi:hypothetical protein